MSTDTIKYRLRKGFNRAQVAVQELEEDVVLTSGEVYETTEQSVVRALDSHHAFERVPDEKKGGEKA